MLPCEGSSTQGEGSVHGDELVICSHWMGAELLRELSWWHKLRSPC